MSPSFRQFQLVSVKKSAGFKLVGLLFYISVVKFLSSGFLFFTKVKFVNLENIGREKLKCLSLKKFVVYSKIKLVSVAYAEQ